MLDEYAAYDRSDLPKTTNAPSHVFKTIGHMFIKYPYWDVAWLGAFGFSLGSCVWVINAFFVFLPLLRPDSEFEGEGLYGGGITALIGATIFEVSSLFLMLEATHQGRSSGFGRAVRRVFHGTSNKTGDVVDAEKGQVGAESLNAWTWIPSASEIRTHYIRNLNFLASSSQLFGATVFWISGLTALPWIYERLSPLAENLAYWMPQVIGGTGFIVSGLLFTIDTQDKWYVPTPQRLAWHVGFWNLIGGLGFTLCPAFGFDAATDEWALFQACCSTFWGSWAFLMGSVVQLYISLRKLQPELVEGDVVMGAPAGGPTAYEVEKGGPVALTDETSSLEITEKV